MIRGPKAVGQVVWGAGGNRNNTQIHYQCWQWGSVSLSAVSSLSVTMLVLDVFSKPKTSMRLRPRDGSDAGSSGPGQVEAPCWAVTHANLASRLQDDTAARHADNTQPDRLPRRCESHAVAADSVVTAGRNAAERRALIHLKSS